MPRQQRGDESTHPAGNYIIINGKRRELSHHARDFSLITRKSNAKRRHYKTRKPFRNTPDAYVWPLNQTARRVSVEKDELRDKLMQQVRDNKGIAHHIYQFNDTGEELLITDRIFLTLHDNNAVTAEAIRRQYKLKSEGTSGRAYIFKVTGSTGSNPLKTANTIAELPEVEACIPELLIPMQSSSLCGAAVPALTTLTETYKMFDRQWYLTTDSIEDESSIKKSASIHAEEAWREAGFGSPDIVIAIIDDGFDIPQPNQPLSGHGAFRNKPIHPDSHDFSGNEDSDPRSQGGDRHGTPVASLATASSDGNGMLGVAPCCTLLPLRIELGSNNILEMVLKALRYASKRADVVNCSIAMYPSSAELHLSHPTFAEQVSELARSGGRRPGKGLVIVFSAGNHDAPTFLNEEDNKTGVKYIFHNGFGHEFREIEKDNVIHSGYPEIEGLVVVGGMSSLMRKAGYSNWGKHLTVAAPSDNGHEIKKAGSVVPENVRNIFGPVEYRGASLVAAVNREGHGRSAAPRATNVSLPGLDSINYTLEFGGTSGAAAIVTGVVALMLSANPNLSAEQVISILKSTADKEDLDFNLDLPGDPNLQGLLGNFVAGHSRFFGSGKVNAFEAVKKAIAEPA